MRTVVTKRTGDQLSLLEKKVTTTQPHQDIQQTVERVIQDTGVLNNEPLTDNIKEMVKIKLAELQQISTEHPLALVVWYPNEKYNGEGNS